MYSLEPAVDTSTSPEAPLAATSVPRSSSRHVVATASGTGQASNPATPVGSGAPGSDPPAPSSSSTCTRGSASNTVSASS